MNINESAKASIEEVKSFWDSRPCNIRHSTKIVGSREYFDEVEERKYFVEPHIPLFANFVMWKNKEVLEIGCGIGTDAINFARAGALYTGVELSKESLSIAKKRFQVYGLRGTLLEADAERLDISLPKKNFDLIYSFGVLHHTPNLSEALRQIVKFANSETVIKIMVYAKNSWKQKMIDAGLDQPEAQFGCPVANSYEQNELNNLFNENGLQVLSLNQEHIFPYVVEEYLKYNYVIQPWFKDMPELMFRSLEKSFGWHMLIEAKLKS
jgi:2-polyprenyl-3-methyl-5-hydroxy-6-metoxy-1,4-benzoquinol methylase